MSLPLSLFLFVVTCVGHRIFDAVSTVIVSTMIALEEIGHLLALPAGALNEDCVAV